MALPSDPIMLLSVVNLKLRDFYPSLDALCDDMDADKDALCKALSTRHAINSSYRMSIFMMEGTYYKEWSAVLDREMEFKVYGHGGVPVLALPARGGRFYDWENNGMPDAAARLLHEGKIQLFCADSIDGESLLAGNESPRRRAEMQEKYFVYLTSELAARIAELNAPESKEKPLIWCVGVDTGAYQAVQCRLRRPRTFAGAMGLSGLYDMGRFLGSAEDDLVLRSSPLAALHKNGICDTNFLSKAEENSLLLCVGQGGYEGDALADTQALADTLSEVGFPCHLEVWGGDVSHDWYWWGKEFGMFAARLFC